MKTKKIVITQPTYIPWIGYFNMIDASDTLVILDDVQFSRQSWQQRNRVKTANGVVWLTVPVKRNFGSMINESEIVYQGDWVKKHVATLRLSYGKANYFNEIFPLIVATYSSKPKSIGDLNSKIIKTICSYLKIETQILHSTDLPVRGLRNKDYVIGICKHLRCTHYLNGPLGKKLYDPMEFAENDIELIFHEYTHPEYKQLHGDFVPYMSILDLLFNCGPTSLDIIRKGAQQ